MKKLLLIICIVWMGVIFYNSSQTGQESNDKSMIIVENIPDKSNVNNTEGNVSEGNSINKDNPVKEKMNFIIRKSAHAVEFLVLTIILCTLMRALGVKGKDVIIYSLFIVLLYAVLDEFHQLYVPGRTSRVQDVVIDFIGGMTGAIIFFIVTKVVSFKNKMTSVKSLND